MACELVDCCQFFKDNMKDLPKAAEYIQNKLCFGDYQNCNRYQIYKRTPCDDAPFELQCDDRDAIRKVQNCMLKKRQCEEALEAAEPPEEG